MHRAGGGTQYQDSFFHFNLLGGIGDTSCSRLNGPLSISKGAIWLGGGGESTLLFWQQCAFLPCESEVGGDHLHAASAFPPFFLTLYL